MKAVRSLIVGSAVLLLGFMAYRQNLQQSVANAAEDPAEVLSGGVPAPTSLPVWWGIYFRGEKAGWGTQKIEPIPAELGGGFRSRSESWFRLKLLDVTREVSMSENSVLGPDYSLRSVEFSMKATDVDLRLTAKVEPSRIAVRIHSSKSDQSLDIPRPPDDGPIYTASVAGPYLRKKGFKAGETHRFMVFDPTTQSRQPMTVEVTGEEKIEAAGTIVPAWKLRQTLMGLVTTVWADADGDSLREETEDGFVVVRETEAKARGGVSENPSDMAEQLSVSAGKPVPDQNGLTRLSVKVSGADVGGMPLAGDRQAFSDGILTVTKEELPADAGYVLPYPAGGPEARFLLPEPMIASDHPKIVSKAREILSGGAGTDRAWLRELLGKPRGSSQTEPVRDPLLAARMLLEWVYRRVDKQPVFSLPNALDVLDRMKGDCNEHTALLTALARAAGIPAKQQAGLMHLEGTGRFYYHAWVSFYLGGRWISGDAVFNQFPADVTHLRFIEGGADRQIEISRLIGRLKLELVEAR